MTTPKTRAAMEEMLQTVELRWGRDASIAVRHYCVVVAGLAAGMAAVDADMPNEMMDLLAKQAGQSEKSTQFLLLTSLTSVVPKKDWGDFMSLAARIATRPLDDAVAIMRSSRKGKLQ